MPRPYRFNPRPGTSPGRSRPSPALRLTRPVSILGRGQAPAAPAMRVLNLGRDCFNPRPGTSPGRSKETEMKETWKQVSILGRGQAPAARKKHSSFRVGIWFQSSAGDKPRPLPRRTWSGTATSSFNPRPGTSPGRSAAGAPRRCGRDRFNPRPGTSPGRSGPVAPHFGHFGLFQSSAGDKPRPLSNGHKSHLTTKGFNPRPGTSPGRSMLLFILKTMSLSFNPRPGTSPGRSSASRAGGVGQ